MFSFFERLVEPFPRERLDSPPKTLWRFVWSFARPIWPLLAVMAVLNAMVSIVEVSLFGFLGQIVDWLSATSRETFFADQGWTLAAMAFVILVMLPGLVFVEGLIGFQAIFGNFPMRFRWSVHNWLLEQSLGFFQDEFAGRVSTKLMQTALALRETITKSIDVMLYVIVYFGGIVFLVASADWRLVLPFAAWVGVYFLLLRYFIPRLMRVAEAQADSRAQMTGRIVDAYANIGTVKLFAHTRREAEHSRRSMAAFIEPVYGQARLINGFYTSLTLLNALLLLAVGGLGLWLWVGSFVSVGAVAVGVGLVLRLNGMSQWVMWEVSALFENIGTIRDGIATFTLPVMLKDAPGAKALVVGKGEVTFDHVNFGYGTAKPHRKAGAVVEDFSLTIRPGEKIGLVGRSGAGKTTLLNLLLRFYDVESGRILIDGQDIAGVTQESLRSQIGMVTQDTSLLHRSIRENILYGRPDAGDGDVLRAVERAQAAGFIDDLTDADGRHGLDAEVGERGVKLSGGQRQRIAIARVMLKDAPILLLDEATSALDSEVEAAIAENLYALMQGKTVIAIAHRLSTIAALDRLIVLDRGRIAEQGTHADLIAQGGIYAQLWNRQVGGFIDAGGLEADEAPGVDRGSEGSGMMDRFLQRFENVIAPFADSDDGEEARTRRVGYLDPLPRDANRFIWHFAKQAKWPLAGLLVTGGLTGGVEAVLYTGVGLIIDALGHSTPATLLAEHFWLLFGLALLTLVGRSLVLFVASVLEEQVISPSFYNRVRWQAYRRLMEQPYTFFQNDFAGRVAQKVQQVGEATGDFIVTTLQTFWSFITFIVLAVTILGALDWRMAVVLVIWSVGYIWIVKVLLPKIRLYGRATADARSVVSGRVVDSFHQHPVGQALRPVAQGRRVR